MSYIIAVSGNTGAGKSTLVKEIARGLNDATTLFFDAYQATTNYPPDMMERLSRGEGIDLSVVKSPDFDRDIAALKSGKMLVDPWGRERLPTEYIIVEEPFGRCRGGVGNLLDFVVHIEIPKDISLARRILRDTQGEKEPKETLTNVSQYLSIYLGGLRNGYEQVINTAAANADLIVDGLKKPEDLAREVLDRIGSPVKK